MTASFTSDPSAKSLATSATSKLSRQHRAWIALYSLYSGEWNLADALRLNEVTEADLAEFEASWMRLRFRHMTTSIVA
ncbi:hypothetical protein [Hymenobacter crusticola]|uniref:Uncharacterized protein n=1 Tax=Hymenobacter crusticola TaxID=1770526 RepID=A0A243WGN3_9BACT|nr:hypothetical protein [Hymenobacter crusticola]OUJ74903.1 hypothetical protein BXP70_09150 [Hymenobacter crusticola]